MGPFIFGDEDLGGGGGGNVIAPRPQGGCEDCNKAARGGDVTWTKWCKMNPFWLRPSCYSQQTETERLN
jgi:hypothetical protein